MGGGGRPGRKDMQYIQSSTQVKVALTCVAVRTFDKAKQIG